MNSVLLIMDKLTREERERNIILLDIYRTFYYYCAAGLPPGLVGTDLFHPGSDLNESAIRLLEEDGVENFLEPDDFVFMMHQGYFFFYFKANGDPDPIVFGYYEQKLKPENFGPLSLFIQKLKKEQL